MSAIKGTQSSKNQKQSKREKSRNKSIVQEVIDLDADNEEAQADPSEHFIGDIAKKCNTFFSWLSNTSSSQLAEHLWKQQMLELASLRFPDFNNEELIRLVDRDWNYMIQQDKQEIIQKYSQCPREEELSRSIGSYILPSLN